MTFKMVEKTYRVSIEQLLWTNLEDYINVTWDYEDYDLKPFYLYDALVSMAKKDFGTVADREVQHYVTVDGDTKEFVVRLAWIEVEKENEV